VRIEQLTEEQATAIAEWRYEFPYEWYDTASDPRRIELFANPARRDGLRAVIGDDGDLVGFFNFVPEGDEVRIGLGIRPDLTGRGLPGGRRARGAEKPLHRDGMLRLNYDWRRGRSAPQEGRRRVRTGCAVSVVGAFTARQDHQEAALVLTLCQ